MPKIHLTPDWHILVDEHGYALDFTAEGALGCIIRIRDNNEASPGYLALKIPRLLADTWKENAFTNEKCEAESRVVHSIFGGGGSTAGLLPLQQAIRLRGTLLLGKAVEDQDGFVVFVSFHKDRPPRFAQVKPDSNAKFQIRPAGVEGDLSPLLTQKTWEKLQQRSVDAAGVSFSRTVYVGKGSAPLDKELAGDPLHGGALIESLSKNTPEAWYAGLPSIAYQWATANLQEAASNGDIQTWTLRHRLELLSRVASGVVTLHSYNYVHGDLRPANVMSIGPPALPAHYHVGDYGSFDDEKMQGAPGNQGYSGYSAIAPETSNRRISPFYAPERRTGYERESADMAAIAPRDDGFVVLLGWKRQLLAEDRRHLRPEIVEAITRVASAPISQDAKKPQQGEFADLRAGDRIRIRDYVFSIWTTIWDGATRYLICEKRVAQVVHDRLSIYPVQPALSIPLGSVHFFHLPRYVEYFNWSAATDVFGVGALALWLLLHQYPTTTPKSAGPVASHEVLQQMHDERHAQQMRAWEEEPYFRSFWGEIDRFARRIDWLLEHDDADRAGAPLAASMWDGQSIDTPASSLRNGPRVLAAYSLIIASRLVQSAPHSARILRACGMNTAVFIMVTRFIFACLHRRSALETPAAPNDDAPFCASRLDQPSGGSAGRMAASLDALRRRIEDHRLTGFRVEKEIGHYLPAADHMIRIHFQNMLEELARVCGSLGPLTGLRRRPEELLQTIRRDVQPLAEGTP